MNTLKSDTGIEVKTIGDSRGYLWRIIIDKERGIGKIEKVSGLSDSISVQTSVIDGSIHTLEEGSQLSDNMQSLTNKIESRFRAA